MSPDVTAKIVEWQNQLLDTSKRNRLIKFSTGRGGGVNIVHPRCEELWDILVGESKTLLFPWKRDILQVSPSAIDGVERKQGETSKEPADIPVSSSEPPASTPSNRDLVGPSKEGEQQAPTRILNHTERSLASPRLLAEHLLSDLTDKVLASSLLRLHRTALESETEHGVSTLFVAFGFLRWYESDDSNELLSSPLVLVPVELARDTIESPWTLTLQDDEIKVNECLAMDLASRFKLSMPSFDEDLDLSESDALASYFASVRKRIGSMKRWDVVDEVAIGNFSFQKLAMYEDMKQHQEQIKGHPLCRAVAEGGLLDLRGSAVELINAVDLDDRVSPAEVTHILDADSSQHEAIEAVKRGAHVVIDGPPGTGKSQTIANCIAELLSLKKRVLFVSEKMAALEVVKRRLDNQGLGDFCLELHSHKANKKEVLSELGRCLELCPEPYPDITTDLHELADTRARLNEYTRELHRSRQPLNKTAYEVHGELASLSRHANSAWKCDDIESKSGIFLRDICDILSQLTSCKEVVDSPTSHPWRGCRLTVLSQTSLADVRRHLELVHDTLTVASTHLCEMLGLDAIQTPITNWRREIDSTRLLLATPLAPVHWFSDNPGKAAQAAIELHAATSTARSLGDALSEFDLNRVAIDQPLPEALRWEPSTCNKVNFRSATLRSRRQELDELISVVRNGIEMLRELKPVAEAFLKLLQLDGRRIPVKDAKQFARIGEAIASCAPVNPKYWDGKFRDGLRTVIDGVLQQDTQIKATRVELMSRLRPSALNLDPAIPLVEISRASTSWWRRLLPSWKRYRQILEGWYVGGLPPVADLANDLQKLREYGRMTSYVVEMESEYDRDLVPQNEAESCRWQSTRERLVEVERFEKVKVPPKLQEAMGPDGSLDRPSLSELSKALNSLAIRLDQAFQEIARWFDSSELETLKKASPSELIEYFEELHDETARDRDRFVFLSELLWDGEDVETTRLSSTIEQIAQWHEARLAAHESAATAGVLSNIESVMEDDWSSLAQAAKGVRSFLRKEKRPLNERTIRGLTDDSFRAQLTSALALADPFLARGFDNSWTYVVTELFNGEETVSTGITLTTATIPALEEWTKARLNDLDRIAEWIRYRDLRDRASSLGIEALVDEVCVRLFPLNEAPEVGRKRFLGQWLDRLYRQVRALRSFDAGDHELRIERFRQLDRLSIKAAPARLRTALLADPQRPRTIQGAPVDSELGTLLKEVNKKRRQRPLRKLFGLIPNVLPRLKPCMMMSPLAVSTYLNGTDMTFDVVIFDEASQVRPHDAICAIYRGQQLVVAGDPKQLPPTNFFSKSLLDDSEEEEDVDSITDFESLLDVCLSLGLARRRLKWHYRSRREGLIAFSNKCFYENSLVTFPSVSDADDPPIQFVYLADGVFEAGVNAVEARRTAELIMDHFRRYPDRSLGAIAFSVSQQNRILDELDALRRSNPDLESCFDEETSERFFVKNLENVQGDERDVIILAVGYGRKPNGTISMNFGPLNKQGGERRLNVAVTRARHAMIVVSSMQSHDIDLSKTQTRGPTLLRAFLDYAERGPVALKASVEIEAAEFDSLFEEQVFAELTSRGLCLHRQIGCSGYRIDLAVVDPNQPGRYLLGIECDGATYHSSATARDRDRLRQAVLEDLGWKICRVWSTDWIRNRDAQVRKVLNALKADSEPQQRDSDPDLLNSKQLIIPEIQNHEVPEYQFADIEEVPDSTISTLMLSILRNCGDTRDLELCKAVSERLGFQRMGHRIEGRLTTLMHELISNGTAELRGDGWVRLQGS